MKHTVALLLILVLAVPPGMAEVVTVQADWAQARTMLAEDGVRPPIRVLLQSGKQLKGKLAGADDAGLMLKRGGSTETFARKDIREIRITYRTDRRLKRILGGGAGLAALMGFGNAWGERGQGNPALLIGVVVAAWSIPVYFWKLGARADRGATVIELVESAASAGPSASPPSTASP